ncbi:exonuclease SbcCD subunit D C-terminal domain-containing protein [Methanospirillum stamsii]|uniref:Nuclease SbcCD subunit D n=1 Tax=Methanospirillum stamsii TaxID=1277351 RepID=A0A2V2N7K0_9EURY|nr:exonuclease SbcCD subunit D C-terminal domain-containing protein [Methanospirillum stamsii]PWR72478.1 exonuclease sbcCD subunit D [Methanospirillum stamsii]
MKILHTSDWHLGSQICGRKRYEEHETFLSWLLAVIKSEHVDILIVAGDVFDSTTPPNRSLEQYYHFLAQAAGSCCRHIIITAGNHDSPSLISAPRELCKYLNINVIGHVTEDPKDMVLVISDEDNRPSIIICPVPYLRDRDVRTVLAGESCNEKIANMISGIKSRYHEIGRCAEDKRKEIGCDIPIIATGHLFAAGGITRDDDGSRDLYLGNLACVGADAFPPCIDYLALGHLHLPQKVCGNNHMRYSGAPLIMGFGEAGKTKSILLIETKGDGPVSVQDVRVPVFQQYLQISGPFDHIASELTRLKLESDSIFVEVLLDDPGIIPDAQERIRSITTGSPVEVFRIKNIRLLNQSVQKHGEDESLDQLTPEEVFIRRMDSVEITETDRQELLESFREIYTELLEKDTNLE